MSHAKQPAPQASAAAPDLSPSSPPQAPDPVLDATIARIEQGSRDMQQYLDSIEQKIARLEPQLERLRQPAPSAPFPEASSPEAPSPEAPSPETPSPEPVSPAAATQEFTASVPAPNPRRRRSDLDSSTPADDRRRSRRQVDTLDSPDAFPLLSPDWLLHLRSPRKWAIAAAALLSIVLTSTWLLRFGRSHTPDSSLPITSTADSVASPTLAPTQAGHPGPSAALTPLSPRPSAAMPLAGTADPAASATSYPGIAPAATPAAGVAPAATSTDSASTPDPDLPVPLPGTPAVSPGRVRVSSGIMAANLLYSRQPEQPGGLARLFHLTGRVTMQVVVSRTGRVSNIHVLSGHRLLRGPAKDAVSTWRYRPFLVNGSPVDVATIVSVDFHR